MKAALIAGNALLLLACGTGSPASGSTEGRLPDRGSSPVLRIVAGPPLAVAGTGFRPGEKVTLLASGGGVESRRVLADAKGHFRARFRLAPGQCAAVVVQAIGSRGSRAHADVTKPDCAAP